VYDALKAILVNDLQVRADDITPTASCVEVGLDSLTVIELASALRTRLSIEIHEYELQELATVGEVVRLMEGRRTAADAEPAEPRHPLESSCQRHDCVRPSMT
jgi:acyl carrier protein